MGQPELVKDPRFTPRKTLQANYDAIHAIIGEWVAPLTYDECQRILDEYGIPASKVYSTRDIVDDPHYAAREQVVKVESLDYGELLQPGIAPRLTGTPGKVPGRAPKLGEHNEDVFIRELGLTREEFEAMKAEGAI